MSLDLYDYQREAVDKLWASIHEDGVRTPAAVMATGSGKTHVLASIAERWNSTKPKDLKRVLVLAHRTELLQQAAERIRNTGTRARVGVVRGTQNNVAADVVVGSVATLRNESRRELVRGVGLIIVDECHHATAESYKRILGHYGALPDLNGPAVAIGFTATMMRGDRAQLGDVWTHIPFSIGMRELIEKGFLVPPVPYMVRVSDLDLSSVKMSGGDYQHGQLGEALQQSLAPAAVIRAYKKHAEGRPALLFTPTVALAEEMSVLFAEAGYRTAYATGATPSGERAATVKKFKAGKLDVLCNCGLFTEGTDIPNVGCVIMMRPTKSPSLFIQIVGRGARVDHDDPNKTDFIFLDVCGASQHHTLSASIELFGEEVPIKVKEDDEDEYEEGEDEEKVEEKPRYADGALESRLIDLFNPRGPAWRQTSGGAWFLPRPGGRILAVVPSAIKACLDLVDMGPKIGDSYTIGSKMTSLAEAMRLAEVQLQSGERGRLANGAKWRTGPPSAVLKSRANAYGLKYGDNTNAGMLHDSVVVQEATRRIDPCVLRRTQAIEKYC